MIVARRLVSAVYRLTIGNVVVRALSLLTLPLMTRWLSPSAYGELALVSSIVALASVFALLGIDMSYSRHYFSHDAAGGGAVETFSWRVVSVLALILALLSGLIWYGGMADWLGAGTGLVGFVMLGIAAGPLSTMAQARARLQGRYSAVAIGLSVAGIVSTIVALSAAYFWRQDSWPLLLGMMVTIVLPIFVLGTPKLAELRRPSGLSKSAAWAVVKVGLAGVVTAPAVWVVSLSNRWFLVRFDGAEAVGIYSIGFAFATLGMLVNSAITSAWLPELAKLEAQGKGDDAIERGRLAQLLLAAMLIVWLAVVSAGGDMIRLLTSTDFHGSTEYVPWLATGVLFYGWMHVGNASLVMAGKLHWAAAGWSVGAIACLAMNAWAVPQYGGLGAAVTQAASFLIVMLFIWLAVVRFAPIRIEILRLGMVTLLFATAGSLMAGSWHDSNLVSLIMKLPLGLGFAAICLWILAPGAWRLALKGNDL